jgi:opacity protein-like surface antigen
LPFSLALLSAAIAGLPVRAAEPSYSWNGCYFGGQLGVASSTSDWTYTNNNPYSATGNVGPQLVAGADFGQVRGVIGAQAGCNRALSSSWLAGVEASWISNALNHTRDNRFDPFQGAAFTTFSEAVQTNFESIVSLTGRLGYAVNQDWLVYAKGGLAAGLIETSGAISPSVPGFDWNDSRWHIGWTVGGGVERRLFRNVTVGVEYNYYKFGGADHSGAVTALDTLPGGMMVTSNPVGHRVDADVHAVMARVNFGVGAGPNAAFAQQVAPAAGTFSSFVNTEVKYSGWTGTRGTNTFASDPGSGYQVYSPTTIGIDYELPS